LLSSFASAAAETCNWLTNSRNEPFSVIRNSKELLAHWGTRTSDQERPGPGQCGTQSVQTLPSVTMKPWESTLLVAWFGVLGCVQAEFFTSIDLGKVRLAELLFPPLTPDDLDVLPGHMTDLIYAEKDLVQSLKEYILVEEAKLSKIKRCLMS
ncbi:P4HA2, partial [Cervus elaphus hippelaphus]